MGFPAFFDEVRRLAVHDPLAEFLGAAAGGRIEYRYVDAVRLAGHSCPTVAAAYWMTLKALERLYPDSLPERGAIRVEFREARDAGVTGVIANVVMLLTGATRDDGFKGIAGRFDRRGLLDFATATPGEIRFTRRDTGAAVDVAARLHAVPADPAMPALMRKCIAGDADPAEQARFGEIWQQRVRALLLDHGDDSEVWRIETVR